MLPLLSTIGYEARTVADVIADLRSANIKFLIDVRALPLSRKPGFSKRQLAAALDEAGIAYLHLRALGTPKPGRDAARKGRTAEMRAIFAEHMQSDPAQAQLAEATQLAAARPCCLLCFEADHRACHRAMVAELIHTATGQEIEHLGEGR